MFTTLHTLFEAQYTELATAVDEVREVAGLREVPGMKEVPGMREVAPKKEGGPVPVAAGPGDSSDGPEAA